MNPSLDDIKKATLYEREIKRIPAKRSPMAKKKPKKKKKNKVNSTRIDKTLEILQMKSILKDYNNHDIKDTDRVYDQTEEIEQVT